MSKITKWLNPAWHRMLYSCTHVAPLGVKGLNRVWWKTVLLFVVFIVIIYCCTIPYEHHMAALSACVNCQSVICHITHLTWKRIHTVLPA